MIDFEISKRLHTVVQMIPKGSSVADIGTDHGYLPIYILLNNITEKVIAMDLRSAPLLKARSNAAQFGLKDKIDFRISDGLNGLQNGEADTIVISGIGGYVIKNILLKAIQKKKISINTRFVLSPQSDWEMFRQFLYENGFKIDSEIILKDNNWFYVVFSCVYDAQKRSANSLTIMYGEQPLEQSQPALKEYIQKQNEILLRVKNKLLDNKAGSDKLDEIEEKLSINALALNKFK